MHEILIRLYVVKHQKSIESIFDERLSFKENLALLSELTGDDYSSCLIMDPLRKIFLRNDVPIQEFEISAFMTFELY